MDILKTIRPAKLYAFADGPANAAQVDDCRRARAVLDAVEWPCTVQRKFMDANLGCGKGPATAMDWFFENETEGIILEDDLLPHPDFFPYCAELLDRYRDQPLVMDICGTNRLGGWGAADASYVFSQWGSSCGRATWRRAWRHFDYSIRAWDCPETRRAVRSVLRHPMRFALMSRLLDQTRRGGPRVTWWDYQWALAKMLHQGLSAIPATNLVRNVGCDSCSHHDRQHLHTWSAAPRPAGLAFPLRHPDSLAPDRAFDEALWRVALAWRHYFSSMLPFSLKQRLKALFPPPFGDCPANRIKSLILGHEPGEFISPALLRRIAGDEYRPMNRPVARENIKLFKRIMDEHRAPFCLYFGTLLGAVRDKDFIAHDYDTDVTIMEETRPMLAEAAAKLVEAGFEFARCKARGRLVSFLRNDEFIDVYVARRSFRPPFRRCWDVDGHLASPELLAEFVDHPFLGETHRIPRQYERLLTEMYGLDWRTEKKNFPAPCRFDLFHPYRSVVMTAKRVLPPPVFRWIKRTLRRA